MKLLLSSLLVNEFLIVDSYIIHDLDELPASLGKASEVKDNLWDHGEVFDEEPKQAFLICGIVHSKSWILSPVPGF